MTRIGLILALASSVSLLTTPVKAASLTLASTIDSTVAPWDFSPTLNSGYTFGVHDFSGAATFNSGNGWRFAVGDSFTITPFSGSTSPYGGAPYADANGDTGYAANDGGGSSGLFFPSKYIDSSEYPVYLNALVGTFSDSTGAIVGSPFKVGLGGTFILPSGASQLQLGFNDDIFGDNTGSINVEITSEARGTVPEGGSTLAFLGLAACSLMAYRKRLSASA